MAEDNKWISALAKLMMGVGGGMTGKDYLGTYSQQQEARKAQEEQQAFQQFMQQFLQQGGGGVRPQMGVSPQAGVIPPQTQTPMPTIPGAVSPIAGSVSGQPGMGFPPSQLGITGANISPTGGSMTLGQTPESKMEQSLYQKGIEGEISAKSAVASQEGKEEAKKKRDFTRVQLKLDQSADLLARTYQKSVENAKAMGLGLEPGRGISGRLFGAMQKTMSAAGYNEYVKTFQGNLNETSIAIMRMLMPGRSERLINLLKATLPDLSGNPYEDISQLAESQTAAFVEAIATDRNITLEEAGKLRDQFKEKVYTTLKDKFVDAGIITKKEAETIKSTATPKSNDAAILKRLGLDPNKFEVVK